MYFRKFDIRIIMKPIIGNWHRKCIWNKVIEILRRKQAKVEKNVNWKIKLKVKRKPIAFYAISHKKEELESASKTIETHNIWLNNENGMPVLLPVIRTGALWLFVCVIDSLIDTSLVSALLMPRHAHNIALFTLVIIQGHTPNSFGAKISIVFCYSLSFKVQGGF